MTQVIIDTYAAAAVVDHCKRVAACVTEAPTIIGFLIGITKIVNKEQVVRVTNILPTSKPETFNEVKAYITSDSRERIIGVYNTRGVDASVANIIKTDQSIYLAVTLPTAKNLTLDMTATRIVAKSDAEGKREFSFTEAPLSIVSNDVGAHVVMATVMSQIFPEVAKELQTRDPLSVESYSVEKKTNAKENLDNFSDALDHRETLPHHVSVADLEKQLADLAKIASEGAKGKNVGGADAAIAKEIAALRAEAKKCLSDLEADGSKQYAEDKIEDVLTAKYIAELSRARLETVHKTIVEAKESIRRYDTVRTNFSRGAGFSAGGRGGFAGGRGGRGGAARGGSRGRGGRGGSRGGFRGRGAAAVASE